MATNYYVSAIGPATFTVAGRVFTLKPSESKGPFSQLEIQQISNSPDKGRLHITSYESNDPAPIVNPNRAPNEIQASVESVTTKDEQYTGVSEVSQPAESQPDPFVQYAQESVDLAPKQYQGTASIQVELVAAQPDPAAEEIPKPKIDSSSTEVVAEYIHPSEVPARTQGLQPSGVPIPVGAAPDSNPSFAIVPPITPKVEESTPPSNTAPRSLRSNKSSQPPKD